VGDDFSVQESIESLIEAAGYEPGLFASADEFLQSGMPVDAACVITDVRMPGTDPVSNFSGASGKRIPISR